ncbi:MAG: HAMP domain-containing histidine kinase [Ruminococcus flavefaciens]|nr:HAMP domain-containing histidine kinase [Ruminococcus flavefaciens]
MKFPIKQRIFTKLIGSFFLFLVIVLMTFAACVMLEAVSIGDGTIESLMPSNFIDDEGNVKNMDAVAKLGGWVEELDLDYRVIKVYGEKKTKMQQYTQDDIYELTAITEMQISQTKRAVQFYMGKRTSEKDEKDKDRENEIKEYIGFIHRVADSYFLCIYSRAVIEVNTTLILNGDDTSKAYSQSNRFLVLFFTALLLEVLLFSLYLRKKIKNPLDRLVRGMERIRSGESGVMMDIKTEAEFEQIVDTFNMMTAELEWQKQENARLIAQKNQMLLELSHDIKTPIATIKSYANALEAGLVPSEKQKTYHHTIDVKADRVQMLAEEMFFMLKMDNPDYHLTVKRVNVCEFLRTICAEYYDEIEEAGFHFAIEIPEEKFWVDLDEKLFARVVENLLSNARKYNKTGNRIGVSCVQYDAEICIRVADDGEPIDSVLAKQMFSAFVRGDKTRKSDGGTGLGLAISKIIVEKHGGTITYLREANNNVFIITIALSRQSG